MKYTWTAEDIKLGRMVCKLPESGNVDAINGWSVKWTFKIGFVHPHEKGAGYARICMSDGMVCKSMTQEAMAAQFNSDSMIPMPHDRLIATMEYLRKTHNPDA